MAEEINPQDASAENPAAEAEQPAAEEMTREERFSMVADQINAALEGAYNAGMELGFQEVDGVFNLKAIHFDLSDPEGSVKVVADIADASEEQPISADEIEALLPEDAPEEEEVSEE